MLFTFALYEYVLFQLHARKSHCSAFSAFYSQVHKFLYTTTMETIKM